MKYFISFLILTNTLLTLAQTPDILLDKRYQHLIDREDIKKPSGFTGVKPYNREDIIHRFETQNSDSSLVGNNQLDEDNRIKYIQTDNYLFTDSTSEIGKSNKPVLRHFYSNKPDLYSHRSKDFRFAINPLFDLKTGGKNTAGERMFLNTRGVEVKGSIDNKIGFYSMVTDNQLRYPDYFRSRVLKDGYVPGENFWKSFKTTGYDFFTAKGYINFRATKHIKIKFGYDKNFIGDGYRSMILSDNAGNYSHVKIDTKIWKINYTNIFADLTADYDWSINGPSGAKDFSKKYLSFHHLSMNVRPNLNIGLFESIIYGADTSGNTGFDINYVNPLIFYRTVESNLGSGGNALLGANFKWNFLNHFSIYGQGILDEFLFSEVKAQNGWWANKYAGQIGIKYIDIASISGLDAQLEYNAARPFTYSHTRKASSYSHFNQSLAHPLGANFNEFIAIVRYQPRYNVNITAKYFNIVQGTDTPGTNYGSDVLLPNTSRIVHNAQDTGHEHLQGIKTKSHLLVLSLSYMVKHNIFLESDIYIRNSSDVSGASSNTSFAQLGLRMNLPSRSYDF